MPAKNFSIITLMVLPVRATENCKKNFHIIVNNSLKHAPILSNFMEIKFSNCINFVLNLKEIEAREDGLHEF